MSEAPCDGLPIPGYTLQQKLGEGGYGGVWLAKREASGELTAIKVIDASSQDQRRIEREIRNHSKLHHPNIVHLHEVICVSKYVCIVLEYVACGNVFRHVVRTGKPGLPEAEARYIFQQLIRGVEYMHHVGVASRDIKLENALLSGDSPPLVKLCDFGFSKHDTESLAKSKVGTPQCIAPEVILSKTYDGKKADIWSCGVMLYAMLTGRFPFQRHEDSAIPDVQRRTKVMQRILTVDYEPIPNVSEECFNLIANLLVKDPERRLSIQDIQRHMFFVRGLTPGWFEESNRLMTSSQSGMQSADDIGRVFRNARENREALYEDVGMDGMSPDLSEEFDRCFTDS